MCVMLLRQPVTGRICIILITIVFFSCISRALGPDVTDYQGLSKQKFRIQQLNMIWDEALKVSNKCYQYFTLIFTLDLL